MKKCLITTLFLFLFSFNTIFGIFWSRETTRVMSNDIEMKQLEGYLTTHSTARVAIVSDLHDVIFDRQSGDIARARQLNWAQWRTMLWNLPFFAAQYGLYKLHLAKHPSIEQRIAHALTNPKDNALLKLISPFKINQDMKNLYQNAHYPVFACSNCGEQSYELLTKDLDKPLFSGIQIATAANGYLQKDLPITYLTLHATMVRTLGYNPDIVIMIDDRQENLERCRSALKEKCPVYGFIFKNAQDLQQTLAAHNITL
jgi:hypothetical protein